MGKVLYSVAILSLLGWGSISASAQDFQKNYQIPPGGQIKIHSSSGNVRISGYDGGSIIVTGYKEGRDREWLEIVDRSDSSHIDVLSQSVRHNNVRGDVRFEVEVPRGTAYTFEDISSSSGDVRVANISGDLRAHSSSGNVKVFDVNGSVRASSSSGNVEVTNASGEVDAKTSSGEVEARLSTLKPGGTYNFESSSGNVTVTVPATLDADVSMSTSSGSIGCEFPISVQGRLYSNKVNGRIGNGSGRLRLDTSSGNVNLRKM
jgi:DUF4097 and DUF4098 domain-containing protein YvlB